MAKLSLTADRVRAQQLANQSAKGRAHAWLSASTLVLLRRTLFFSPRHLLSYHLIVQEVHGDGGLVVLPAGLATREPEEARARGIHRLAQNFPHLLLRHAFVDLVEILLTQTCATGG